MRPTASCPASQQTDMDRSPPSRVSGVVAWQQTARERTRIIEIEIWSEAL